MAIIVKEAVDIMVNRAANRAANRVVNRVVDMVVNKVVSIVRVVDILVVNKQVILIKLLGSCNWAHLRLNHSIIVDLFHRLLLIKDGQNYLKECHCFNFVEEETY